MFYYVLMISNILSYWLSYYLLWYIPCEKIISGFVSQYLAHTWRARVCASGFCNAAALNLFSWAAMRHTWMKKQLSRIMDDDSSTPRTRNRRRLDEVLLLILHVLFIRVEVHCFCS